MPHTSQARNEAFLPVCTKVQTGQDQSSLGCASFRIGKHSASLHFNSATLPDRDKFNLRSLFFSWSPVRLWIASALQSANTVFANSLSTSAGLALNACFFGVDLVVFFADSLVVFFGSGVAVFFALEVRLFAGLDDFVAALDDLECFDSGSLRLLWMLLLSMMMVLTWMLGVVV